MQNHIRENREEEEEEEKQHPGSVSEVHDLDWYLFNNNNGQNESQVSERVNRHTFEDFQRQVDRQIANLQGQISEIQGQMSQQDQRQIDDNPRRQNLRIQLNKNIEEAQSDEIQQKKNKRNGCCRCILI